MTDLEYLKCLITECKMKEGRRFVSVAASIEFNELEDKISLLVRRNKNDKQIIMTAAKYDSYYLNLAGEKVKKDPELILFALTTPNIAKYINSYGFDENVLKAVKEELDAVNNSKEDENVFYALDGSKFPTPEEALAHNESLINSNPKMRRN